MPTSNRRITLYTSNYLKKFEDLFYGMLDTWNTTPVDLELKDDAKHVSNDLIQYRYYTKKCS